MQTLTSKTCSSLSTGIFQLQTIYVKVEMFGKDGEVLYHWITDVSRYVEDILHWYLMKNRGVSSFSIRFDEQRRLFRMEYIGLALKSYQQRIADPGKDAGDNSFNLFVEDYYYPFQVVGVLSD